MRKNLIKLLTSFIVYRPWRKKARMFLMTFRCRMLFDYSLLSFGVVAKKSVLLIEPNICHGEVLPGMAKYFMDLGYKVSVVLSAENFAQKPFCRMPEIKVFCLNEFLLKRFLLKHADKAKTYDKLVLTTSAFYNYPSGHKNFCALDAFLLRKFDNLYVVEHELALCKDFNEEEYLRRNRLIVLGNFDKGVMVNPHYFGKLSLKPKNRKTNFIVVGGLSARRKNHEQLFEAVAALIKKGATDFKVTVVGRGALPKLPKEIKKYIDFKGMLHFPRMYREMEKADFFLPLLDGTNPDHERYITTAVTGSAQLIYGFLTPLLIERKFASFYGFDNKNACVYDAGDLAFAMQTAMMMTPEEYEIMRIALKKLADDVYRQSLKNLKRIL